MRAILYLICLHVYGGEQWFLDAEEMASRVGKNDVNSFLSSFSIEVAGSQFLLYDTIWGMIYDALNEKN